MNCLSLMLNKAAAEGKFGYHPHCSNLQITHLCFADDLLIFTDGSLESVTNILSVLQDFQNLSGLGMNISKTSMVASGVDQLMLNRISEETGISLATLPFQYLGLPLSPKKLSMLDCAPLIERIKGKVCAWSVKSLSYAGRLQLIQSVINGITNYWTMAFILPKRCITTINSICCSFLWKGTLSNHYGARVAWTSITIPKEEGGLGLRDLHTWNKACALKLIWLLLFRRNSLWVAWFTSTVLGGDIHRLWMAKNKQKYSWLANKLIKWKSDIFPFTKMQVGNGKHTSFWYSPWSPFGSIKNFLSLDSASTGIPLSSTLHNLSDGENWRLPPARSDRLVEIQMFLSTITLTDQEDSYSWKVNDSLSTTFSTGKIYDQLKPHLPVVTWDKIVWTSGAIPRHAFLTWLMVLNRCPTRDRMLPWGLQTNPKCLLCDLVDENRDHLYFECDYSGLIWTAVCRHLQIPLLRSWTQICNLLTNLSHAKPIKSLILWSWQASIYFLWMERNSRLHRNSSKPLHSLLLQIDSVIRNRASSLRSHRLRFSSAILQAWFSTGPLTLDPPLPALLV